VESEEPVHQHLAELFTRIAPECVLDVGANAGQYGAMLRRNGYRGWIVSFEPVRSAFEDLAKSADGDGRWHVFQLALGSHPERRRIAVAEVNQLSSFRMFNRYASQELPGASDIIHDEEVEVRTLNDSWEDFLRGLPQRRVFLKLDTQGWELEVLQGANRVFDRLAGIQLEASLTPIYDGVPTFAQAVDHVTGLGFDLTGVFPVNRDSLFRLIEVDCVFINARHAEAHAWREDTWAMLTERLRNDVAAAVPAGSSFVLIDGAVLGIDELAGRRAIPFLERDGEYYGAPEDGEQAVAELGQQMARGVRHVAVAWPSFWWLEEYPELARHLQSSWRRVVDTDAAIVFELGPDVIEHLPQDEV
jgi:FkbM family methyltransferase